MAFINFPDRVILYVNGDEYFKDGRIFTHDSTANYNVNTIHGFSRTRDASGRTVGNRDYLFSIKVYFDTEQPYISFDDICNVSTDTVFAFAPFNAAGSSGNKQWTYYTVSYDTENTDASGQGNAITQTYNFKAVSRNPK